MNILIIENNREITQLLEKSLKENNNNITKDNYKLSSRQFISKQLFDIALINTSFKNNTARRIIKIFKKDSPNTKLLGISNKGTWIEKVSFLNNGGDDVLTYPFPLQELKARMLSLTRRSTNYKDNSMYIGNYTIDTAQQAVYKDNKDLGIRKKEYALLEYLAINKNRTISRCELLDHVWDYRQYIGSNTIDVHIKRLRNKLKDNNIIETVHGVGYKISSQNSN